MKYEVSFNKQLVQDLKAITGLDPVDELWHMIIDELKPQFAKFWDEQLLAFEGSEYKNRPETDKFVVKIEWK